jgi:formylglycine-generating enzyme required for sulfatase activity
VAGAEAPKDAYNWGNMNDARLNQLKGTLAKTGAYKKCRSGFGAFDMVGNLHEWTANPKGTFRGGYYLDTHQHGDGCDYKTTAHKPTYHDYSTGFRCCK